MKTVQIGQRRVGPGQPCFIIAELSCNHGGSFDTAVKTVEAIAKAGADCVKLQTIQPGAITIDSGKADFVIKGGTLWDNRTLFDLYSEVYTPWEWHEPLRDLTHSLGMEFFSSPFDPDAVEFLERLGVPAYKIASFEITDIPLIEQVASKGKPIIISTGIAHADDIRDALQACRRMKNDQVILLKCTSAYPTPLEEVNLAAIPLIRDTFQVPVGLSDHTEGGIVPAGAVALGAVVVEKHFILDRSLGGPDAAFSMEPHEFADMVKQVRFTEKALGSATLELSGKSEQSRSFARSLYIVEDVREGEVLTSANVRSIRPGMGLPPKHLPELLGKRFRTSFERGTPLQWDLIQ